MEGLSQNNQEHLNEQRLSQDAITLEYSVMQKYFNLAGVPKHQVAEWITANGGALRNLVEKNTDFLEKFANDPDASKDEFEKQLAQYH
ncbi:MAG: hypothetical protein HZB09_02525 [Candidatus Yonathbacteria bacterium]|nr:hypothetical protein [Candidatus Yonathbacteria bacterium]